MINSDNYRILKDRIFEGREDILKSRLKEECNATRKNAVEIIFGTNIPSLDEVKLQRDEQSPEVFAIGGGGGFNQVTLTALQMLGASVAAGVPSTDDGGNTGQIRKQIADVYGYMFGVGDASAILENQVKGDAKKPILSYRIPLETKSLTDALVNQIKYEMQNPSIDLAHITDCPDFLSFICEQLNFARIIDNHFLGEHGVANFSIKGASIRNLNLLAAFYKCGAIDERTGKNNPDNATIADKAELAWHLLEKAYDLVSPSGYAIRVLPVTYQKGTIWATYEKPIPKDEIKRLEIPESSISNDKKTVYGQQYIDKIIPAGKIADFGLVNSVENKNGPLPRPNESYLKALRTAKLIIMGAGSLFSSQLSQLCVPGVLDEIILRKDTRRILILNHVCMNETMYYSLSDHIRAIEKLANKVVSERIKNFIKSPIKIGDIFSDVVVPLTVAREIDIELNKEMNTNKRYPEFHPSIKNIKNKHEPVFVDYNNNRADSKSGILRNRYVEYVLKNRDFREKYGITNWELRILGFLEQPHSLYSSRSEAGRYRGAVYALPEDIDYIVGQRICRRNIYEVECIALNKKMLKEEGKPQIEEFPGLIPESLVGIFKILLVKGVYI